MHTIYLPRQDLRLLIAKLKPEDRFVEHFSGEPLSLIFYPHLRVSTLAEPANDSPGR